MLVTTCIQHIDLQVERERIISTANSAREAECIFHFDKEIYSSGASTCITCILIRFGCEWEKTWNKLNVDTKWLTFVSYQSIWMPVFSLIHSRYAATRTKTAGAILLLQSLSLSGLPSSASLTKLVMPISSFVSARTRGVPTEYQSVKIRLRLSKDFHLSRHHMDRPHELLCCQHPMHRYDALLSSRQNDFDIRGNR